MLYMFPVLLADISVNWLLQYGPPDKLCPDHQLLTNAKAAYDATLEENQRKNTAQEHLIDNFQAQTSDTGAVGGTLKTGFTTMA